MLIECFSRPKCRKYSRPNEDSLLMQPGIVGVFDGATDALGRVIQGKTPGLHASETLATYCGQFFAGNANFDIPAEQLMTLLSRRLNEMRTALNYEGFPATTLALAIFKGPSVRFILNGDSGIRINGTDVLHYPKPIDDVSTQARIQIFRHFVDSGNSVELAEKQARKSVFEGLRSAVKNGLINAAFSEKVVQDVTAAFTLIAPADEIEDFLLGGIAHQVFFANRGSLKLGYSTLNGSEALMRDVIDVTRPVEDIQSLELFTDGYFKVPDHVTIEAWETAHAEVEAIDPHKTTTFRNVKGSTKDEFTDDRSVIILRRD